MTLPPASAKLPDASALKEAMVMPSESVTVIPSFGAKPAPDHVSVVPGAINQLDGATVGKNESTKMLLNATRPEVCPIAMTKYKPEGSDGMVSGTPAKAPVASAGTVADESPRNSWTVSPGLNPLPATESTGNGGGPGHRKEKLGTGGPGRPP